MITAKSFLFDVATATTEMERQRNRSSLARWLRLSDDVATATTEMERSGIEVAVLLLMPESFRSCGDSHTSMQRQRNRSSLARWLGLSDDVATATTEMEHQRNRSCGSPSYA